MKTKEQQGNRIKILDGFRCIAILLVIVFHYYSRWTPPKDINLYPYGAKFKNIVFDEGGIGVQFFFMISGFVIYFTLQRSKNIFDFLYRRFVRLWPTLLLCACITFFTVRVLDSNGYFAQQTALINFLPSLLFTNPETLKQYFNIDATFMDGAYWSLVVEVKFYIIIAIVYFVLPNIAFIKKWSFIFSGMFLLHIISKLFHLNPGFNAFVLQAEAALLYNYIFLFTFGIFCFEYFLKRKVSLYFIIPVYIMFHCVFLLPITITAAVLYAIFFLLFIVFLIKPEWLFFLQLPPVQRIGIISYALYLLHQNIGITLINKFGIGSNVLFLAMVPVLVFFIILLIAQLITRYFEPQAKKILFKLPWFKNITNNTQNNLQLQSH